MESNKNKEQTELMSKRGLKTRMPIGNAIDINYWNAFNSLAEKTRINKSKLLDEAIRDLLIKYDIPFEDPDKSK